jgi:hypothetical protein|tara:strand:+ start:2184 stop:3353 length:1170 start_codon:yes stop_codon:yes gene_type:complete
VRFESEGSQMFKLILIINILLFGLFTDLCSQTSVVKSSNDSLGVKLESIKNKIHQIDKSIEGFEDDLNKIENMINENLSISTSKFNELSNTINSLSDSLLTKENEISILKIRENLSFKRAFLEARLKKGKNDYFEWNGKLYKTDFEDESKASPTILEIEKLRVLNEEKQNEFNNAIIQANSKVDYLNKLIDDSKNQIKNLNKTITDQTLYWIIAILILLILVFSIFFFLKTKVIEQKDTLSSLKNAQKELENESIQLFNKIIQNFEQKLDIASQQSPRTKEIDHSLPIILGENIHRMKKKLKTMDESQATKVLNKRIETLEEKLNDMGYLIIDLVGRNFDDGMELGKAQFIPDPNLKAGERIISRVIKPRITYNEKIIQNADVEISQGD